MVILKRIAQDHDEGSKLSEFFPFPVPANKIYPMTKLSIIFYDVCVLQKLST